MNRFIFNLFHPPAIADDYGGVRFCNIHLVEPFSFSNQFHSGR